MPLQVDGSRIQVLGPVTSLNAIGYHRRTRELSDIAPQYVAKSGLCSASELESSRGGSIRIQHVTGLTNMSQGKSRFPKLDECAHFHYEHVELGPLELSLIDDDDLKPLSSETDQEKWWSLSVTSQNKTWLIRRSYSNFRMLDQQLHRCIYDRKFSELPELPIECIEEQENIHKLLQNYLKRFSAIAVNVINCGPVLNWLELDNRGYRLLVPDTDNCPINTPAVAAAYSVKRYIAQAPDEISFEVGDMISVIDMPPPEESIWWRGKRGFQVGFFPCECVAVIGDKVPRDLQFCPPMPQPTKPVLRKHGKLIAFFRSFILSRPSRRRLKQSGILRERVFGCDLGEHLLNSGHEIPVILKCCVEFIETHGLVDGIYRLSGITSNIQKLRNSFDEDRIPSLYEDEAILQDVHSVASLLKMYFRELPNPLCTYQLYHQFVGAIQAVEGDDTKLMKMRDVVQKLPPPHYRTLEYLMRHLCRVSEKGHETGMTSRNVAIVWAPNLLRCKELEVGGVAALQGVGVQAVVTEFLVCYADLIFCDKLPSSSLPHQQVNAKKCRPKSLAISTPTKLLSLEEARMRALNQGKESEYIEVGEGPANIPAKYHTVIELPGCTRKRMGSKRSPIGWKMFFGKSGRGTQSRKEVEAKPSQLSDLCIPKTKLLTESDLTQVRRCLRATKSTESLSSTRSSTALDVENLKNGLCSVEDSLGPLMIRRNEGKSSGHNRSVSHESYFDQLQTKKEEIALDISEIQINFDLEESEMRIFSEDETLMSNGSGSLTSVNSPRILGNQKLGKISGNSVKRFSHPKLASSEDRYGYSQSADPSPKKLKTSDGSPPRSKLEEQLSGSAGDIQFIDSVSPDQGLRQFENELIQSPSPVSSISQISSSVMTPSSPILPHIPHLSRPLSQTSLPKSSSSIFVSSNKLNVEDSEKTNDLMEIFLVASSSRPLSTLATESGSHSHLGSPSLVEATVSDNESFSLQSSEFTTPETPICCTYTPLIDIEESKTSSMTTPDFEVNIKSRENSSETSDFEILKSCLDYEKCQNREEKSQECDLKNTSKAEEFNTKPFFESIDLDMVKVKQLNVKENINPPKPEERKPKPVHPYVNIPIPFPEVESRKVLETAFDGNKTVTSCDRKTISSFGCKCISTESSSDSLIDENEGGGCHHVTISKSNSSTVLCDSILQEGEGNSNISSDESLSNNLDKTKSSEMNLLHECANWLFENQQQFTKDCPLDSHRIVDVESDLNEPVASGRKNSEISLILPCKNENQQDIDIHESAGIKSVMGIKKCAYAEPEFSNNSFVAADLKMCEDLNVLSAGRIFFKDNEIRVQNEIVEAKHFENCSQNNSLSSALPSDRILETDLDDPIDSLIDWASLKIKKTEGKPVPKKRSQSLKSSSIPKIQNDVENGEKEPEKILNLEESLGQSKAFSKSIIENNEFRKEVSTQNTTNKCSDERPKTLERLSTKRKSEKEAHKSSQIRLEKSKSGSQIDEERCKEGKADFLFSCELDLSDPQRRERIEKYKEKRRNYLREKYRPDSFKSEKDDIVTKIKQKHFQKIDSEEISARDRRSESSSECSSSAVGSRFEKLCEKKTERSATILKFSPSKTYNPNLSTFSRKPDISERKRLEKPSTSTLKDYSPKKIHFKRVNSESSSANEFRSSKNSTEKKNAFSDPSLENSSRQSSEFVGPRIQRRMTEPSKSKSTPRTAGGSSMGSGNSQKENSNRTEDVADLFDRQKDSKPAKQYLSSV